MSAPDLIETDNTIVVGKVRHWLALEALGEIAVLCDLLRVSTKNASTEEMQAVRGLSIRMGNLIDAATCALDDAQDQTDDIATRVGIELPAQEGDE